MSSTPTLFMSSHDTVMSHFGKILSMTLNFGLSSMLNL